MTTIDGLAVNVDWSVVSTGGSQVTGFRIYVRHQDGVSFTTEPLDCDGDHADVIANSECTIPISTLRQAPFSLEWGSGVYVKVVATNIYGDSIESDIGNGAMILTYPDAPVSLAELYSERTATSLGLQWIEGPANGGASVFDYIVSYDQGTDTWIELQAGVSTT